MPPDRKSVHEMSEEEWEEFKRHFGSGRCGEGEPKAEEPLPPELLATFCEYRVADTPEALTVRKQITYFTTAEGLMEVRKLPFGVLTQKCEKPLIPIPLLTLAPGLTLEVPKLPWEEFQRVVGFFRQVSKEHDSEAIVQVFYSEGVFILHVPKQKVGAAHIDHSGEFDREGKMLHLMDIHSHVNMAGFFSSTDDADEKKNVRIYGVIGKIDSQIPEVRFRLWSGREFITLDIGQVVEMPEENIVTAVPLHTFLRTGQTEVKAALNASFDPFRDADVPREWMAQLDTKSDWSGQGSFAGRFTDTDPASLDEWLRTRGHRFLSDGGRRRDQHLALEPPWLDRQTAISTARLHADKLVYVTYNGRVFRAEGDGTFRLTALTLNGVQTMKERGHGKRAVIVLAAASVRQRLIVEGD